MPDQRYIEQFLSSLSSHRLFSANTLSAYKNDLTQFSEYLEQVEGPPAKPVRDWASVGRDDIISFLLYIKGRQYAPTTVARKQAAVKSFFRFLTSERVVASNPTEEIASPHVDRALPHTISASEVNSLIDKMNVTGSGPEALRDRAMMQLLYATGLRVGEMVALNVSDVDVGAGLISTEGRGKVRQVPVGSPEAAAALADYLERGRGLLARAIVSDGVPLATTGEDSDALFLNHRGQRLTRQGFWLILKGYARLVGLTDVSPHTLRHSFAAEKLKSGADVHDLQKMMGHASISTTQVYTRIEGGKPRRNQGKGRPKKAAS